VSIPYGNEKDLVEIPKNIKGALDIRPVKWIDEVLELALERPPVPLSKQGKGEESEKEKSESHGASQEGVTAH